MQLNRTHLPDLDARVAVPSYDPATLTPGIVHIGVGGFHRAHQAVYLDRLLNQGQAHDWAIIGLGLLPGDAAVRNALAPQDHLYTVTEKHPDGTLTPRVVGAMIDYLFAPDDPGAALALLVDPAVRIVSLTITEGGYHVDQASGNSWSTRRSPRISSRTPPRPPRSGTSSRRSPAATPAGRRPSR